MTRPELNRFEPLLKIVCCPVSKTPLTIMSLGELQSAMTEAERARIPDGTIGALVSTTSARAYPIIGDVISFLNQDVLKLSGNIDTAVAVAESASTKLDVKRWYDEFGWKKTDTGEYIDTSLFSQTGRSAHGFYETVSHLSLIDRFMEGEFFLDAASGAIAHPEYLAYTWFYKYRVCVDMSLTALREASAKLGPKGYYCLADICGLPFRDNVFDGIVSGYTIQHIPESDQRRAVSELCRVLGPGKFCCIMNGLEPGHDIFWRVLWKLIRIVGTRMSAAPMKPQATQAATAPEGPSVLYTRLWGVAWWKTALSELNCDYSLKALRLINRDDFEDWFGNSMPAARLLRFVETSMPRLLCKYAKFGLMEFTKPGNNGNGKIQSTSALHQR